MDGAYIRARDLTKIYKSGSTDLVVFADLSLDVARGEMLALVGESGCGKSTLLHLLGGLDRPSRGTIHYQAREISGLANAEQADFRNREIGFVWQTHYLLPEFTALENVMMPLLIRGVPHAAAAAEALTRLDEVELGPRSSHRTGELSGGEQQRVALARALAGSPAVLLADEPTGNLDTKTGEIVLGTFQKLNKEGHTVVLITHERDVAEHAQKIIMLRDGEIIKEETTHQQKMAKQDVVNDLT